MTANLLTKWWFRPIATGWHLKRTGPIRGEGEMNARISDEDMEHLREFSKVEKMAVMQEIMSHPPAKTVTLSGHNDFEKSILKLRRDGFGLIDVQPQETVCTTTWYRRKATLLRRRSADVAMLLWEIQKQEQTTTLVSWTIRCP
jgi:hypothetical protein